MKQTTKERNADRVSRRVQLLDRQDAFGAEVGSVEAVRRPQDDRNGRSSTADA